MHGAKEFVGGCGWISTIGCVCGMDHSTLLDGEPAALCGRWYNIEPVLNLPDVQALETVDAISPAFGEQVQPRELTGTRLGRYEMGATDAGSNPAAGSYSEFSALKPGPAGCRARRCEHLANNLQLVLLTGDGFTEFCRGSQVGPAIPNARRDRRAGWRYLTGKFQKA
jgi:hypothetical protein